MSGTMRKVTLGARGPLVSRLLLGTLTMGPLQRSLEPEEGAALLCYAATRGITCVDTAEYYGTYPHIRLAIEEIPNLRVVTKSYAHDRDGALRSVEMAQDGIGREHIDVFLMHEQESGHTLRGHAEAFETYLRLKADGVIGAVGISTHYVEGVRAATAWPGMDVVFPLVNRRGLGILGGTLAEMEAVILAAHDAGLGVMAMKVLGGGHLIGDREAALGYALRLPGVDAVAIGMQSRAEIDYNAALFSGLEPDADAVCETARVRRELIVQDWCAGCGRCVARCGRRALAVREGKAIVNAEQCILCGYCAAVCPEFCLKVI